MTVYFDEAVNSTQWSSNFKGYQGNPPTNEDEYNLLECWDNLELAPSWDQIQQTIAQVKLNVLRTERNQRLANTDWWASSDLTMTAEQTAYRTALRDITETYRSLDDVVWPEEPNV